LAAFLPTTLAATGQYYFIFKTNANRS